MRNRRAIIPIALLVFLVTIGIFFLFQTSVGKAISAGFEVILSPLQQKTHQVASGLSALRESSETVKLADENRQLTTKLAKMQDVMRENQALQDQFKTQQVPTHMLIPASVISAQSFIPGVSPPETLTIDKGQADGVVKGSAVVYQNNLVGKIATVFPHASQVMLVTNNGSSLTVKTVHTHALGIARGQDNDGILLDNVILSDKLTAGDIVETKGDLSDATAGVGVPPNLVVGKVLAIHKRSSSLFQTADIESLLDFSHLETVFVITR